MEIAKNYGQTQRLIRFSDSRTKMSESKKKDALSMRKGRLKDGGSLGRSSAENVRRHHLPEDGELRRGYENKGENKDEPEL